VKKDSIRSTVIVGLVYSLLLNAFLYLGQLLIARTLSRTDYATFLVATNFVALCALLADLGLTPLFVRLFTEAHHHSSEEQKNDIGQLFGTMLLIRVVMSVVVFGVVEFVAPRLGYSDATINLMTIFLASLIISSRLLVIRSVGEAYLRGVGKYRQYMAYSTVDALCFAVGILTIRYYKNDLMTMLVIYTFCNIPGFLLLARSIYRDLRIRKVRVTFTSHIFRTIGAQGLPLILGSVFLTIHSTADPLLLDKLSSPYEVSAFGAAVRIQSALLFLPAVFALVIAPEATKLLVERRHDQAKRLVTRALSFLLVISCGFALVITALPTLVVTVIFGGDKYLDAAEVMMMLTWTFVGTSFAYFIIEMGIAEGNQWLTTIYMFVIMIVSVILDIVLIPDYGARGSGISRLIAVSCGVLVLWWKRKELRVLDLVKLRKDAISLAGIVLVCGLVVYLLKAIHAHELVGGLATCIVFLYLIHKVGLLTYSESRQLVREIWKSFSIRSS
jgi:O-antigen/teichoic acid export membrane protein